MAINSNNRNPYNQLDQYGNPINPYIQVDQYGNPINQYSQVDYMQAQYYNGNQNPYQGVNQPYGNQNPYNGSNPNSSYYKNENKTRNVNQRRPQNNQTPYNQPPYNQNQYNQNQYNQNPYNQNPYNQNPYVGNIAKNGSRLNNQYNQNQYGNQYNQNSYGNHYNQNQYRPKSGASLMASNFMWNYGKYIGAGIVGLFGLQMLTGVNFFGWIFKIAFGRVGAIILIMAIIAKILSFFGSSLGEEVGGLLGKGKDWVNDKINQDDDNGEFLEDEIFLKGVTRSPKKEPELKDLEWGSPKVNTADDNIQDRNNRANRIKRQEQTSPMEEVIDETEHSRPVLRKTVTPTDTRAGVWDAIDQDAIAEKTRPSAPLHPEIVELVENKLSFGSYSDLLGTGEFSQGMKTDIESQEQKYKRNIEWVEGLDGLDIEMDKAVEMYITNGKSTKDILSEGLDSNNEEINKGKSLDSVRAEKEELNKVDKKGMKAMSFEIPEEYQIKESISDEIEYGNPYTNHEIEVEGNLIYSGESDLEKILSNVGEVNN